MRYILSCLLILLVAAPALAQIPTAAITEVPSSQVRIRPGIPQPLPQQRVENVPVQTPDTLPDASINNAAEQAFSGNAAAFTNSASEAAVSSDESINIGTVRGLQEACKHVIAGEEKKAHNPTAYGQCFGYVRGVIESYMIQRKVTGKGGICLPNNGTWLQYIKVFLRWSDANPAMEHKLAWHGLVASLSTAFPCRGLPTSPLPEKPSAPPAKLRNRN